MKTRLMTLVVIMAVSMSSFGLMAQNTPDAPAQKRAKQRPTPGQIDGQTCEDDGEETPDG